MNPAAVEPVAAALARSVVRDDILAMNAYHVPASAGLLKLDAMENPYELPAELQAELGRRLSAVALNRYPSPSYAALKAGLRRRFGVPDGFDVIVGNGSDELISLLSVITARPGATVVAPAPSFVMYEMSARFAGSRFVPVPLAAGFSLDADAMLAAIARERPALVYLAYPNNPTGNCFDDAAIERVLRAAPGLVVVDEAYQPFAIDSWMSRLASHPNLLVMRTVSKLGLAGIRLGYAAAAPAWLEQMEKVRPPYNVNVLTEAAALFALDHLSVFDEQARRLREDREVLAERLAAIPGVQVFPSRANFLLVRVADGPKVWRALHDRGVLVKDVGRMHPSLANCLRMTVGTPGENSALVAAMQQAACASSKADPS